MHSTDRENSVKVERGTVWSGCAYISQSFDWDKFFKEETPMSKFNHKRKPKEDSYAEAENRGRRHPAVSAA